MNQLLKPIWTVSLRRSVAHYKERTTERSLSDTHTVLNHRFTDRYRSSLRTLNFHLLSDRQGDT
jgi:hypothetical protein